MTEKMREKRNITAVICELDPLHLGHRALFQEAKRDGGALVCVLSGNFVQRGEPAILDKWARTRLALENGADLVIELPLPWACAGAERFAAGGVCLAGALGNVDSLLFGSEEPDLSRLEELAEALLSPEFSAKLAALPDRGETFARRREEALAALVGAEAARTLRSPNAILGVEYLKAIRTQGAALTPRAFPRQGAAHNGRAGAGEFRSAGELRELLRKGRPIGGLAPESTVSLLRELSSQGGFPSDPKALELPILCKLRTMEPEEFAALPDVSEGLEHRLYQAARQAGSLEEFYGLAKSKRYTLARLRRLSLSAFLGLSGGLPPLPPYLRVLGMTKTGEGLLKEASPTLPIAARAGDFQRLGGEALRLFRLECRADDLYALSLPIPAPCGRDCTEKLLKL